QGLGDPRRDRDAAAGKAHHDGILQWHLAQAPTQPPPGLLPVGEGARTCPHPHAATVSSALPAEAGALVPAPLPPRTCRSCRPAPRRPAGRARRHRADLPVVPASTRACTAAAGPGTVVPQASTRPSPASLRKKRSRGRTRTG